mmetsp:Transcript_30124/g.52260  ORF Transcript_30124/g.52260 Transcript_30124/m.52260 type:complete len:102 (-) Transcript_30124:88-393(-)
MSSQQVRAEEIHSHISTIIMRVGQKLKVQLNQLWRYLVQEEKRKKKKLLLASQLIRYHIIMMIPMMMRHFLEWEHLLTTMKVKMKVAGMIAKSQQRLLVDV